jgi:serine/threonine protein kinase
LHTFGGPLTTADGGAAHVARLYGRGEEPDLIVLGVYDDLGTVFFIVLEPYEETLAQAMLRCPQGLLPMKLAIRAVRDASLALAFHKQTAVVVRRERCVSVCVWGGGAAQKRPLHHSTFAQHADVKPDNLVLDSVGNVVLIDAGLSDASATTAAAGASTSCASGTAVF